MQCFVTKAGGMYYICVGNRAWIRCLETYYNLHFIYFVYFILKGIYIAMLILAYVNHTMVITAATDGYILPFINMLHAAYVCKTVLPEDV
jgi:hypothetical protein